MMAKGIKLLNTINLVPEARAIKKEINYSQEQGINHIIVEFDSIKMAQILKGMWKPQWYKVM